MTTGRGTRGLPRADREAEIIDAATALFGAHGHARVSVGAIAEAAGVSKALVLSYFGSKDALYLACVDGVVARVMPDVAEVVRTAAPGFPMALATMRATFEGVRERPTDWRLLHDHTLRADSDLARESLARRGEFAGLGTAGVTATLRRDGHLPDPHDVEAMTHLWTDVVASAMTWWFAHPEETPDSLTERFTRIVQSLLT